MSLGFSITAIKSTNTDAILDILAGYYDGHGLTLVEERIGNRAGKYATSPRSYSDLQTYCEQELKLVSGFTSNFAIAENLPENTGWTLLEYSPHYAEYTPNYHSELTRLLSSTLKTVTFEYSEIDSVGYYYFKSFDNGQMVDAIDASQGEIYLKRGQFADIPTSNVYEPIRQKIQDSYQFDLEADDMHEEYDMQTRRRFYLKGSADSLLAFLKGQSAYEEKQVVTYQLILDAAVRVRKKYNQLNERNHGGAWDGDKLMAGFVGDVGDLSKIIMAKSGHRAMDNIDEKLKHELSDCLWSILVLANYYNVDLETQFLKSMDELEARVDAELSK